MHAKFCLDRFIVSAFVGEKKPIFAIFWTSAFSVVANWQQSEKIEHRCTTTDLPLSKRLHGEIRHTIFDVDKRDEQTYRQTDRDKKNNVFGHPGGG